jgi:hypothetical protein
MSMIKKRQTGKTSKEKTPNGLKGQMEKMSTTKGRRENMSRDKALERIIID